MNTISHEIVNVAYEQKINVSVIDDMCCNNIVNALRSKYSTSNRHSAFLWDGLLDASFVCDINGWTRIKYFINGDPCILIISDGGKERAFEIMNGTDLDLLLANAFSFEFYITDSSCSFLICFNHHNQLIGCGSAKKWVDTFCK